MLDPKDYLVGVTVIDYEHAFLIDYINKLENKEAHVGAILEGLSNYANRHFLVEEELMVAYDYPQRDEHKRAHAEFRSKIASLWDDSGSPMVSSAVVAFLKGWLVDHIITIDKAFAAFLSEKGISAPLH